MTASLVAHRFITVLGPAVGTDAALEPSSNGSSGEPPARRLAIVSLLVRAPAAEPNGARWLHHSFVCALLNDVFGIQARPVPRQKNLSAPKELVRLPELSRTEQTRRAASVRPRPPSDARPRPTAAG